MTSEQIKATKHFDISATHWLKEIAYQLALLNENRSQLPEPAAIASALELSERLNKMNRKPKAQ